MAMFAVRVGTDIASVSRFSRLVRTSRATLAGLFTEAELRSCGETPRPESLAGRFAAKEAVAKALGTGFSGTVHWREIEVTADERGKPWVTLHRGALAEATRQGMTALDVSIAHERRGYAIAVAVLVFGRPPVRSRIRTRATGQRPSPPGPAKNG